MLMKTVQLTGAESYDSHMEIYISTENTGISLVKEFQKKYFRPNIVTWLVVSR